MTTENLGSDGENVVTVKMSLLTGRLENES